MKRALFAVQKYFSVFLKTSVFCKGSVKEGMLLCDHRKENNKNQIKRKEITVYSISCMRWYSGVRTSRLRHYCTVQLRAVQAKRSFKNDNRYRVKRLCNSAGAFLLCLKNKTLCDII